MNSGSECPKNKPEFYSVFLRVYTPSMVYKRHGIRDTSQNLGKNKIQRLVWKRKLRDNY